MTASLPRALVWDDDPSTSRAVTAILCRSGFEVIATVVSPADALMAVEFSAPDVVVVDLALTGDLGLGMISAFRAAQPRCAIVVLSPFEALRPAAIAAGAYDVVVNAASDLRALERCLVRAAADWAAAGPLAEADPQETVVAETSAVVATTAGKRRTKAPFS